MSKHEETTMDNNYEEFDENTKFRIVHTPQHKRITKRIRDCRMTFTLTDDELEQVRAQMEKCGFSNMSAFFRKMLLEGLIVNVKIPGIEDALQVIYEEGHQINMATKRINSAKTPDVRDVEIMKESVLKIKASLQAIVDQNEVDENPFG